MAATSNAALPSSESMTLYGDRGPDRYDFIQDGILDRRHDGTDHKFRIDGREFSITISRGHPIPPWQCPEHPQIPSGHEREWEYAYEFWGCGGDGSGAYHIHGVYSPKSRKGVYHLWPIYRGGGEGCPTARQDLNAFFAGGGNSEALLALERAMEHMVRGTAVGRKYHVDCQECWEIFGKLRQSCWLTKR